jgi:hypothetical protein
MPGSIFAPVMQPYDVRVIAIYLAKAFNGDVQEVPPTRSPVWGLATRMVMEMRADNYHLGAYARSELNAQRPHVVAAAAAARQVRPPARSPVNRRAVLAE